MFTKKWITLVITITIVIQSLILSFLKVYKCSINNTWLYLHLKKIDFLRVLIDKDNYLVYFYLGLFVLFCNILYVLIFMRKVSLNFGGNKTLEIFFGDIFKEESTLKVIAANEYFDTIVDNKIIAKGTLHGKVIEYLERNGISLVDLDNKISNQLSQIQGICNSSRLEGKQMKYPIGTTIEIQNNFIFSAFSRFDSNHRVIPMTGAEYNDFLIKLWENLDTIKNDRNLDIPFIGTGNANIANGAITYVDILHIMILTFKLSKISFSQNTKARLILHSSMKENISLLDIKNIFNKGE